MSLGRILKRVGTIIAMPVTVPAKAIQRGAEKTMTAAILGVIRHVLTTVGGMFLVGDDVTQFVGAVMTLIGLAWSIVEKRRRRAA